MKTRQTRQLTLILSALGLVGALAIGQGLLPRAAAAETVTVDDLSRTITVVGHGTAATTPDLVKISLGVEIIADDLESAMTDSSADMQAITKAVMDVGVAAKDIQTWDFSIWCESTTVGDGEQAEEIARYHVTNMILVKIRALDQVNAVLSAAVASGANSISSVSYEVEDMSAITSRARAKAVAEARAHAEELASLTGVAVGAVVNVSEVIGASEFNSGYTMSSPDEVEVALDLQIMYVIK